MLVVLLDYWSVWLGGQYAAAQGDAYVTAAATVTDQVNTAIKTTALATNSAYVDLRTAFKGPDHTYDETHYLAPDGDHPNAAGHRQIAAEPCPRSGRISTSDDPPNHRCASPGGGLRFTDRRACRNPTARGAGEGGGADQRDDHCVSGAAGRWPGTERNRGLTCNFIKWSLGDSNP